MLQLMHIKYWSGKQNKSVLILALDIDQRGKLVGLKSNKLHNSDINKILNHKDKLSMMKPSEIKNWLMDNIANYKPSLCELKAGRYKIIESYSI